MTPTKIIPNNAVVHPPEHWSVMDVRPVLHNLVMCG